MSSVPLKSVDENQNQNEITNEQDKNNDADTTTVSTFRRVLPQVIKWQILL